MNLREAGLALAAVLVLAACVPARPKAGADINSIAAATQAAARRGDHKTVIEELTILAQRWPDRLSGMNSDFIARAVNDARRLPSRDAFPFLQALYGAHWKLKGGIEPSAAWRDLALLLLERNRQAEAFEVASRIGDPYVLISIRADRRFDSVVAANPARFAVDAAAQREFHDLEAASDASPRLLVLQVQILGALMHQRHYAAMLGAADSVLAAIRSTNYPEHLYDDLSDQEPWFLEYRSIALYRMGRWDDAVTQLQEAADLFENHAGNVSQRIDLGELDCDLGRPKDALAAIGDITAPVSPYGGMQIEKIRLEAAVQLGDGDQVKRSLGYLRMHRAVSSETYEEALIAVGDVDGAARVLTGRIEDPRERLDALASVQEYASEPQGPGPVAAILDARFHATIAREDVQGAIRRVGRVERYDLAADFE
jgi:tetratricopeptide (TPR) repeat protein